MQKAQSLWSKPHLIHVYVVVVGGVVDGFEEALKLAGRSPVHHQDKRYSDRFERVALGGVLVPLDVGVGFTCEAKNKKNRRGLHH